MRKVVNEYNSTLPYSTTGGPPSQIELKEIKDDNSSIWQHLNSGQIKEMDEYPLAVRKEAIKLAHKRTRAQEEDTLAREDMVLAVSFCIGEQKKLVNEIGRLSTLSKQSNYTRGSCALLYEELLVLECYIKRAHESFNKVENLRLPDVKYIMLDKEGIFDPLKFIPDSDVENVEDLVKEYLENEVEQSVETDDMDNSLIDDIDSD